MSRMLPLAGLSVLLLTALPVSAQEFCPLVTNGDAWPGITSQDIGNCVEIGGDRGLTIDARAENASTLLETALAVGAPAEIIAEVLAYGANPNLPHAGGGDFIPDGLLPLELAGAMGRVENEKGLDLRLAELISAGADGTRAGLDGMPALLSAIGLAKGQITGEEFRKLYAAGADLSLVSQTQLSTVHVAVFTGTAPEALDVLLKIADVDLNLGAAAGTAPLHLMRYEDEELAIAAARALIEAGADPAVKTAMGLPVWSSHPEMPKLQAFLKEAAAGGQVRTPAAKPMPAPAPAAPVAEVETPEPTAPAAEPETPEAVTAAEPEATPEPSEPGFKPAPIPAPAPQPAAAPTPAPAAPPVQVTYNIVQMEYGKLSDFAQRIENMCLETGPEVTLEKDGMTVDEICGCAGGFADHKLSRIVLNPDVEDPVDMDDPSEDITLWVLNENIFACGFLLGMH